MQQRVYFATYGLDWTSGFPYHWGILRAYAETDPNITASYEFMEPIFSAFNRERVMAQIERPAVFAASCYVWNFRLHMKLMREVKERFPNCLTIAGGPHIAEDPEDAREVLEQHPYIDVLVHGEGELPFQQILLERLKDRPDLLSIPNLSVRIGDRTVHTGAVPSALPKHMLTAELPSPYILGYFDRFVPEVLAAGVGKHGRGQLVNALWETNRGCPYACAFCEWGSATMTRLKRFETDRLKQEVDWFAENKITSLFFADANFGILERDLELAKHLVAAKERTGYPILVNGSTAKNSNDRVFEIVRMFNEAKMTRGATLAMQSVHEPTLEASRRSNIGKQRYIDIKKRYDAARIPAYVDLILGLPEETEASFKDGLCELLDIGMHESIRVFELALLPNTPMRAERDKHGLVTVKKKMTVSLPEDEAGEYDTVMETASMSHEEWLDSQAFFNVMIATMHNGAYTRFGSQYLASSGLMTYRAFYRGLFDYAKARPDSVLGTAIHKVVRAMRYYIANPSIVQNDEATTIPWMREDIEEYISSTHKHRWYMRDWPWFRINKELARFYELVVEFVKASVDSAHHALVEDLFAFQRDIMLTPEFDLESGKSVTSMYDWPRYFFQHHELVKVPTTILCRDQVMGVDSTDMRHALAHNDKKRFAIAAAGIYFLDGTHRRFYHQPDCMQVSVGGGPFVSLELAREFLTLEQVVARPAHRSLAIFTDSGGAT